MYNVNSLINRSFSYLTGRVSKLPILILMPHSRCNCRCVMCDIWKANNNKKEISEETLLKHISAFRKLKVTWVVLSGGEALMHTNLWRLCSLLKKEGMKISLLSTGLQLKKNANEIINNIDDVIVSLDGSREVHNQIRNVPKAFEKLEEGVRELKTLKKDFRVTARSVVQRANYHDFPNIVLSANDIGLDQVSFLAADVSSNAFNREVIWGKERVNEVALSPDETNQFSNILEESIAKFGEFFQTGFIAEQPDKLRKIVAYYNAVNGHEDYPKLKCNAPWVSAVIESNGDVLPCYFHKKYGNIYENPFEEILNGKEAIRFRNELNVSKNPTCQKCVCYLNYRG